MLIFTILLPENGGGFRVTNGQTEKEEFFLTIPKKALKSTQKPFNVTLNLHESLLQTVEKMDKDSGLGEFIFIKYTGIKFYYKGKQ